MVVCKVFQERMAVYGKCLFSSFVMCFKSVWHFTGIAYYRRLLCVSRASGILSEIPLIVMSHVFKDRLVSCGNCLL